MQLVRFRTDPYAFNRGAGVVYVDAERPAQLVLHPGPVLTVDETPLSVRFSPPVTRIPERRRCMLAWERELHASPELPQLMVERVRRAMLDGMDDRLTRALLFGAPS